MPTKKSKKITRHYRYTLVFKATEGGSYIVTIPAIDGLSITGATLDSVRIVAGDAIRAHLKDLASRSLPFPIERGHPTTERIEVELEAT